MQNSKNIFVEIKSAVLRVDKASAYPDCPSERGRHHIKELPNLAKDGKGALIIFIAGLPNTSYFTPAKWIDPEIYRLLKYASLNGVEIRAMSFDPVTSSIILENPDLPVRL